MGVFEMDHKYRCIGNDNAVIRAFRDYCHDFYFETESRIDAERCGGLCNPIIMTKRGKEFVCSYYEL